jgi:Cu(I)/Ag(I) efflux system periplasmic protein CusF
VTQDKERLVKLRICLTGILLAFVLNHTAARAQSSDLIDGVVTKVDASAQKITIKHGPLKKFNMEDGMTMVFRAQDPAMLKAVKAGDKVKFVPERINGQFTVTKIDKAK